MKLAILKNPLLWSVTIHAGIILPFWIGASAPHPQGETPTRIAVHFSQSVSTPTIGTPAPQAQEQPVHKEIEPSRIESWPKDIVAKVTPKVAVETVPITPIPTVQPVPEVVEKHTPPDQAKEETRPDPVQEITELSAPTHPIQQAVQLAATLSRDIPDSIEVKATEQPRVAPPVAPIQAWSQSLETPVYPKLSRQRGEEGTVIVLAQVGQDGRPEEIEIIQSSGYRNLNKAVVKALKKSTLDPGEKCLKFTFRLQDNSE